MIYVGKYYQKRANELLIDRIGKTGYRLNLYTGPFPTFDDVNSTTLDNSQVTQPGNDVYYWTNGQLKSHNNGMETVAGFETKKIASLNFAYDEVKLTPEGVFYALQTMRSLTAAVDGPITWFELINKNLHPVAYRTYVYSDSITYTVCSFAGAGLGVMSGYGSVYGTVGEVGTNNNLTVSKQNVLTGEQFYMHDLYLNFETDVAAIKTANPTLI